MSFIHFRTLSSASFGDGALRPQEIVDFAVANDMPAIALTDMGNFFQALAFSKIALDKGVQPIHGIIAKFNPTNLLSSNLQEKLKESEGKLLNSSFMTLIPTSHKGWSNLSRIVTKSWLHDLHDGSIIIPKDRPLLEDILLLSGSYQGLIGRSLIAGRYDMAENICKNIYDLFGENFIVEIIRSKDHKLELYENFIYDFAKQKSLISIASSHACYAHKSLMEAHAVLRCIANRKKIDDSDAPGSSEDFALKTDLEMREIFKDNLPLIDNTLLLAQKVRFCLEPSFKPKMPEFSPPAGQTAQDFLKAETLKGLTHRLKVLEDDKAEFLKSNAGQNAETQKDEPASSMNLTLSLCQETEEETKKRYLARMDEELSIIAATGYNGYFLIVADFVNFAHKEGIPVGPGRGSGAASLVAWSLGITGIDPLRADLLFERFINPERLTPPDFDIDFCQERRDEVINYVVNKYGKDKVAHIITIGRLQARAVTRDVGRVMGIGYSEVDGITKLIPEGPPTKDAQLPFLLGLDVDDESNITPLAFSKAKAESLRETYDKNEEIANLLNTAIKLEGLLRNASRHAAGVVISDKALADSAPLMLEKNEHLPITQFDMESLEAMGFLKFDFLGLTTLTIISKTLTLLEKSSVTVDLERIPIDDLETFHMLQKGEVFGVFQLESGGMRRLVMDLKCDSIDDIVASVALFRPGPMQNIDSFIASKLGTKPVTYLHDKLKSILKVTHGIPVYQEQVLRIAQILGGYSLAKADLLRRAMGKKKPEEMKMHRKIFVEGAKERDVKEGIANKIFDMMEAFAGYGFNKAHAASYATISYRTAWLKRHYPCEFIVASMNVSLGDTDRLAKFIEETRRLDITFLRPCVNNSYEHFSIEKDKNQKKAIRYGIEALKTIGSNFVKRLVENRETEGEFSSLEDFFIRMSRENFPEHMFKALIKSGALDSLESNRYKILSNLPELLSFAKSFVTDEKSGQNNLFSENKGTAFDSSLQLFAVAPWMKKESLDAELEIFGFHFSGHPLDDYAAVLKDEDIVLSCDLEKMNVGTPSAKLAGIVRKLRITRSARGGSMLTAIFSDQKGEFRAHAFDDDAHSFRNKIESLQGDGPLKILVAIKRNGSEIRSLNLMSVDPLKSHAIIEIHADESNFDIAAFNSVLANARRAEEANNHALKEVKLYLKKEDKTYAFELPDYYDLSSSDHEKLRHFKGVKNITTITLKDN